MTRLDCYVSFFLSPCFTIFCVILIVFPTSEDLFLNKFLILCECHA